MRKSSRLLARLAVLAALGSLAACAVYDAPPPRYGYYAPGYYAYPGPAYYYGGIYVGDGWHHHHRW